MSVLPLQQWVIAFQWHYDGNSTSKQISKQEATRDNLNGAIIRIGRDEPSCNLYLKNSTVSGQHAEIYFNDQEKKFFIKSLQSKNITKVDGQDLTYGKELSLKENSIIILGQQKIQVTNIQIYELQSTNYSGIVNPNPNSSQVNTTPNSSQVNPTPNSSQVNTTPNSNKPKPWWKEPTIQTAIIGGIVALVGSFLTLFGNWMSQETQKFTKQEEIKADKEKQQNKFKIEQRNLYLQKLDQHREKVRKLKGERKKEVEQRKRPFAYRQLTLKNDNCPNTIKVAFSFTALDDISETRGWFLVNPGLKPIPTGAVTEYDGILVYAETKYDGNTVVWQPELTGYIERFVFHNREFNYIQEPFLDPNKEEIKDKVKFYHVKFNKNEITPKVFKCSKQGNKSSLTLE